MRQKYAVCIGINDYPGTGADLHGCVNDALDWSNELRSRGYDVITLLDTQATKAAILNAVARLVAVTGYLDRGVITYSGHGTWVPDRNGDETDGRDEALVPYDYASGGLITDDELYEHFTSRRYGARLFMVSDSCHSGTLTRALFNVEEQGTNPKFLPPVITLPESQMLAARAVEKAPIRGTSRKTIPLLAGCAPSELAWDAYFNGRPNGALTRVALDTLPLVRTYGQWIAEIRKRLPSGRYPQTPQLDANYVQRHWGTF